MTTLQQKTYADTGNAITFKDSGGSAVITLQNLAYGSGRVSANYDRGANAKPCLYEVLACMQWEDNPAAADYAQIQIVDHDGTTIPGTVGASDAAVTVEAKLRQAGASPLNVFAEAAAGSTDRIARTFVVLHHRYVSVIAWNSSGTKNFKNSANVSYVRLTPVVEQMTDA